MSRRWSALLVLSLTIPLLATPQAVARRAPCPMWLDTVSAVAPDLVWIGGSACGHPTIQRWDGATWQVAWRGANRGWIAAIAAAGPDEAWAVGTRRSARLGHNVPLIRRWDGADWTRIGDRWAVDHLGPKGELTDVEVVSSDRAWAVGCAGPVVGCYSNGVSPLVLRRDADGKWRPVSVPSFGRRAGLTSVDVAGEHRVWVVGWVVDRAGENHPLVLNRLKGAWVRTHPVVLR